MYVLDVRLILNQEINSEGILIDAALKKILKKEEEYLIYLLDGDKEKFFKCIDDYKNGYAINDIKNKYQIDISNYLKMIGIKRSNSESKKTKIYKNKYENSILQKYGVKNISQSEVIKTKKRETFLNNHGYKNNFCNPVIRKKAQENIDYDIVQKTLRSNLRKKYGNEVVNVAQIPGVREKIGRSNKARLSKLTEDERRELTAVGRFNINYRSKLELRIQEILNRLDIEYTANKFLYRYSWDFVFKNKVILEVQGDFWHANPLIYNEDDILLGEKTAADVWKKDLTKKNKVEKHGYKLYYLWESEIQKMTDEDIIEFLKTILT